MKPINKTRLLTEITNMKIIKRFVTLVLLSQALLLAGCDSEDPKEIFILRDGEPVTIRLLTNEDYWVDGSPRTQDYPEVFRLEEPAPTLTDKPDKPSS